MNITVANVAADGRPEVETFYRRELGREVPLEADQEVFAARDGRTLVGALRLCPEAKTLVLRTVVVADGRRGQGIGRSMLAIASDAIGRRECWCFPWEHLEGFYGAIGFRRVDRERIPPSLLHRLGEGCIPTLRQARS
jgi:N-acetylglutamate synthase-like GNAT family acetyltransferase